MRARLHPMSRDSRGRLGVGFDLDYGPGRDPMSVHIDVPREFEAHAKRWLAHWIGAAKGWLDANVMGPRAGLPMPAAFGAMLAPSSRKSLARARGAQASRAFRRARAGQSAGMLANIAEGVSRGDRRALEAAEKLEDAAKASQIAQAIAAGDPRAIAHRERLEASDSEEAAEAAGMIDSCLKNRGKACNCAAEPFETAEEALDDLLSAQWDADPYEFGQSTVDRFDKALTYVKNAGSEMADEMLVPYENQIEKYLDGMAREARYEGIRARALRESW